jgi:alpha-tubulin suppressor-like RCC1 family protein
MSTINVTNLRGKGGASPNLPDGANVTGVVTATSFVGSGEGLTGVASTDNIITGTAATFNNTVNANASLNVVRLTTTGITTLGNLVVTKSGAGAGATVGSFTGVTTYYGDGANLTGVGESIAPWHYNPDIGDTDIPVDSGIGITFNKKVLQGSSGTATLKVVNAGAAGTTIQSWGVSSCTYNLTAFSLGALVSDLAKGNTYQLDIPEGFIVDSGGANYAGTAYTFAPGANVIGPWSSGYLYSWGNNQYGVQGKNDETQRSEPIQIGSNTTWKSLGRNSYYTGHTAAIKSDNTLWSWGLNTQGNLGHNNTTNYSSPVQVPGTAWAASATGSTFTMAVRTDGTLWTWGGNTQGRLGHNNTTQYSSPKQVPGTYRHSDIGGIAAGAYHAMAIKSDGTLWIWGKNGSGELGQNDTTTYSSPRQIPGTTWKLCAADIEKSLAIKTDGTFWSWGKNQHGQLGHNSTTVYASSPIQVPGSWAHGAFGDDMGIGIKTDGTFWAWGANSNGQLGQNTATPGISSPIQIPGSNWSTSVGGADCSSAGIMAVKTDGTLWGWGYNVNGQLGLNNQTKYSSPVQVGTGEGWEQVINEPNSGLFNADR